MNYSCVKQCAWRVRRLISFRYTRGDITVDMFEPPRVAEEVEGVTNGLDV